MLKINWETRFNIYYYGKLHTIIGLQFIFRKLNYNEGINSRPKKYINHKLLNLVNVPDWNNYPTTQCKTIQSVYSIITKIVLKKIHV